MTSTTSTDISLIVIGSGGAGAITVGELLLQLAGDRGSFAMMRGSFGPQIRGGEAAAMLRISDQPVQCMDNNFDLVLSLDWQNAERFAEEINLRPNCLVIADPAAGEIPATIRDRGIEILEIPLSALAREVADGRANMLALGILAHWLGFNNTSAKQMITKNFQQKGEAIISASMAAFNKGFTEPLIIEARKAHKPRVPGRRKRKAEHWQLTGNEACGLGALRGGIRFAAAYPITPSTDILEWLSPRLGRLGGSLVQAEDELAAINMVIGASFGGIPSMTATSGPGFALMLEAMGLAVAAEIPTTVVNVMRGGPSTGIPTKSEQTDLNIALYGLHGDAPHLVLGALDHADCILTTEWAVRLAEALQTLAVVLTDQSLAQTRVLIPKPDYQLPEIPPRSLAQPGDNYKRYQPGDSGVSPMAIPGTEGAMYVADGLEHSASGKPSTSAADHQAQLDKRSHKISSFEFGKHWADIQGKGTTAIITWGSTTGAVREAAEQLRKAGQPVKVIAIRLLLPASPKKLAAALKNVTRVLVVEQSHSRQFHLYLRAYYDYTAETRSLARPGPALIRPEEIVQQIASWS